MNWTRNLELILRTYMYLLPRNETHATKGLSTCQGREIYAGSGPVAWVWPTIISGDREVKQIFVLGSA